MTDEKRSRTWLWILIGGGAFFLFVLAVFTLVYLTLRSGGESAGLHGFGDRIGVVDLDGVILDSTTVETEEIRCVSLDSFMSANAIAPIDVLKVDVQGLEGAVLRGAQTTLESVQYLFLEVTWLDLEGVQRILPAAEHYGFNYVAVVNEVYTGADLLFTRKPLTTEVPNLLRFPLGGESAGKQWF